MTDVSNCVSKIPSVDVIPKVEAMITVYERASAKYAQLLATDESTDACANVWQRRLIEVCEATALSEESAIKSLKELGLSTFAKDSAEAKSKLRCSVCMAGLTTWSLQTALPYQQEDEAMMLQQYIYGTWKN
ncbi:hypothetical protein GE09DRAFT_1052009 [Coniochaeta sp. 2T2.1]|nr:hypothetical protein GE09DRAFT_1052009 [Coniochaeta sp. 2T2.1]